MMDATSAASALICLVLPCFTCLLCHSSPAHTKCSSSKTAATKSLSIDQTTVAPILDEEWKALLILQTVVLNLAWLAILVLQGVSGNPDPVFLSWWERMEPLVQAVMLLGSVQIVVHYCRAATTASTNSKSPDSKTESDQAKKHAKVTSPVPVPLPTRPNKVWKWRERADLVSARSTRRLNPTVLAELKLICTTRCEVSEHMEVVLRTAESVTVVSRPWAQAYYVSYRRLQATQHVRIYTKPNIHQQLIRQAKQELLDRLESVVIHRVEV